KSPKSTFALLLHELRSQGTMKMMLERFCVVSASIFKAGLMFWPLLKPLIYRCCVVAGRFENLYQP
ncbi:MAG: hypothetical protein RMY62_026795, partial [Nostoc sp. ZfuVER08]